MFYSIRSERQLMDHLQYNMLFRWFVGLAIDDVVWDHSVFTKNRERLNDDELAATFLAEVCQLAKRGNLLSDEHFSVDGTLLQAWTSHKSFQRRNDPPSGGGDGPRNAPPDFKGERRHNDTHESTSDPDARLFRKSAGSASQLSFMGHALMEHRSGLIVAACATHADGHGERDAALNMLKATANGRRRTLAADKAYDTKDFVAACREQDITPHVIQNTRNRKSAIDGRTARHAGYRKSIQIRAWIETHFGWVKSVANIRQVKQRGLARIEALFQMAMAASNLVRLPRLLEQTGGRA